jgi:hypothetical protein
MPLDTVVALGIVAAAIAFLARRALLKSRARKTQGPGCDNCGH